MKNEAQIADTKKTTSLLKKYLKAKFGVTFSITTEKYSGGSSMRIGYNCGPDNKLVEAEVACLAMGSFNGMEDIYEYETKDELIIDGYKLAQVKYVFVEQSVPEELLIDMADMVSSKMTFEGTHRFDGDLYKRFNECFGEAWTWNNLLMANTRLLNFVTDKVDQIKITGMNDSMDFIFIYEFEGKTYSTASREEIRTLNTDKINSNLNTNVMKEVKFEKGQFVNVSYKNGTEFSGTIIKVSEKSLQIDVDGNAKLVMLSNAIVILADKAADKPVEKPVEKKAESTKPADKSADKADEVKVTPFGTFILELASVYAIDKKEVKIAEGVVLTKAGITELNKIKKAYKAGKYDNDPTVMLQELGTLGKNKSENPPAPKADDKKVEPPKQEEELHPAIKLITEIKDDKSFDAAKKEVDKVQVVSKKKGFAVTLEKFENGNVYVKDEEGKNYYSMPARFAVHFTVK